MTNRTQINVRCSPTDLKRWIKAAKKHKLCWSAFVRLALDELARRRP